MSAFTTIDYDMGGVHQRPSSIIKTMSSNNAGGESAPAQFELPPAELGSGEQGQQQALDQAPSREGAPTAPSIATAPPPTVALPIIPPTAGAPSNVVLNVPVTTDSGLTAADSDLIEKEWIVKAKDIVAKTQDDPYHQKKEISKVKAEYIQKRFNKTLKTDDAAPV